MSDRVERIEKLWVKMPGDSWRLLAEGPESDLAEVHGWVARLCASSLAVPGVEFCGGPKGALPPDGTCWRCRRWASDAERDAALARQQKWRASIPGFGTNR
jgi:hypothetical protein